MSLLLLGSSSRNDVAPDTTPPTLVSATVAANGRTVTLVFSEPVTSIGNAGVGVYYGAVNGIIFLVSSGLGTTTLLCVAPAPEDIAPVIVGDVVTIDYSGLVTDPITDLATNPLADFSGHAVVNDSTVTAHSQTWDGPQSDTPFTTAGKQNIVVTCIGWGGTAAGGDGYGGGGGEWVRKTLATPYPSTLYLTIYAIDGTLVYDAVGMSGGLYCLAFPGDGPTGGYGGTGDTLFSGGNGGATGGTGGKAGTSTANGANGVASTGAGANGVDAGDGGDSSSGVNFGTGAPGWIEATWYA